jgi:hypothetical protein
MWVVRCGSRGNTDVGCEVCDALPHRRRLAGVSPSTNSTLHDFKDRDVFDALTIFLVGGDDVSVVPPPQLEGEESSSASERVK